MPEWHKSYDFTLERGMQTFDLLVPAHVELALAAVRGPAEMRVFTMARHGFAVFDSTVGAPPSVWANGMYGVVAGLERAGDGNNNPWMLHVTVEAPPSRGPCTIKLTGWKPEEDGMEDKALNNENTADAAATTSDIKVFGDPDTWQLICKASSKAQGWMKSTKAMPVHGGVLVQVSTQQGDRVAEAVTFVPGAGIVEDVETGNLRIG
jgi:hypothetical protein